MLWQRVHEGEDTPPCVAQIDAAANSAVPLTLPPARCRRCCHHACGRHDRIRAYNAWVGGAAAGAFATVVTAGAVHEVNPRDRAVLGALLGGARLPPTRADLGALPFDLMREF